MLRGCQREMIVLMTRESPLFESAYFVLRRGNAPAREGDMLAEANRLIGEGSGYLRRRRARRFLPFLLGFLAGSALLSLVVLILVL